jgi:hypothetical protein
VALDAAEQTLSGPEAAGLESSEVGPMCCGGYFSVLATFLGRLFHIRELFQHFD